MQVLVDDDDEEQGEIIGKTPSQRVAGRKRLLFSADVDEEDC